MTLEIISRDAKVGGIDDDFSRVNHPIPLEASLYAAFGGCG